MLRGVAVRLRRADDRPGDRAQPGRRPTATRRCATPRSLAAIADPAFQTELGRFNLEINVAAAPAGGRRVRRASRTTLAASLNDAEADAAEVGAHMVMIGILPTLLPEHLDRRVHQRQPALRAARRADPRRPRRGPAHRHRRGASSWRSTPTRSRRRPPARACSSTCRSRPTTSPRTGTRRRRWPASRSRSAPTRRSSSARSCGARPASPLFMQATDTRAGGAEDPGGATAGLVRRALDHLVFDLFEENVRYFPALLPDHRRRGPARRCWRPGGRPRLQELRLHNGTVYRWNRPVYDVVDGRAAPAGGEPGAAGRSDRGRHPRQRARFYFGALRCSPRGAAGVDADVVRRRGGELHARRAQDGIDALLYWPGLRRGPGRPSWCCAACCRSPTRDCSGGASTTSSVSACSGSSSDAASPSSNGAAWQAATVRRLEGRGDTRLEALRRMTQRYVELMHTNEPVHTWPLD